MTKPLVSVSVRKKASKVEGRELEGVLIKKAENGFTVECQHAPSMEAGWKAPVPYVATSLNKAFAYAKEKFLHEAGESAANEAKEEAGKAEESDEEG
jgi:hypothetical protein